MQRFGQFDLSLSHYSSVQLVFPPNDGCCRFPESKESSAVVDTTQSLHTQDPKT